MTMVSSVSLSSRKPRRAFSSLKSRFFGAQDGVAGRADHALHQLRLDAFAGLDGVGMAGEQDRRLALAFYGRQLGHQVAVGVFPGGRPQLLEFLQEIIDEAGLVARFAVDLHHIHELLDHPLGHASPRCICNASLYK